MNSLKVLGAAAAVALVLPLAIPSAGFAQQGRVSAAGMAAMGGGGGGARVGGGGGGFHGGGAAFHGGGGGAAFRGGGGFHGGGAGIAARPSGMPQSAVTAMGGGRFAGATPGRNWNGGGGNWHGGGWRGHRNGGFWPGVAAGATIGALGSYAYYGGGGYYNDPYYYGDDGYYDDGGSVAVVPDSGGDSVSYCQQRYKSYDVASGTYLGYDGQRHPCP